MSHSNNFNLIRLLAALAVVFTHYYHYFDSVDSTINLYIKYLLSLFPGVPVFFIISGYLISISFSSTKGIIDFGLKRVSRIYPGLWVCLIISIFTVWLSGYWDERAVNYAALIPWVFSEITFGHVYSSTVFEHYGIGKLNGSLWTIPVELQFYAVLPFIMIALKILDKQCSKLFNSLILFAFCFALFFLLSLAYSATDDFFIRRVLTTNVLSYLFFFSIGIVFSRHDWLLGITKGKFLLYFVGYIIFMNFYSGASFDFIAYDPIQVVALSFVIFSGAFSCVNFSSFLLRNYDLSYGVYIYHMIIANFIIEVYGNENNSFTLAIIFTLVMAFISWFFLEKKCIYYVKNKLQNKPEKLPPLYGNKKTL